MKLITLTQGKFAKVDDDDYERLVHFKWRVTPAKLRKDGTRRVYAMRSQGKRNILMHRELLGFPKTDSDHSNGDGLDNQRGNLRVGTRSQNTANASKRTGCTSRFKGVSWHKGRGQWEARLRLNGVRLHLGMYRREENAATAYNFAAAEAFGDFVRLNLPERRAEV